MSDWEGNAVRFKLAVFVFCAVVGCSRQESRKSTHSNPDLMELQGEWKCIGVESGGKKVPKEKLSEAKVLLKISEGKFILGSNGDYSTLSFSIDPNSNPKAIDTKHPEGRTSRGIYRLDGDRLTWCDPGHADLPRPTEFSTPAGTPQTLWTFERVKHGMP